MRLLFGKKSNTADHVFARKLFREYRRQSLPKVPSCERCNRKKSQLEHYLAAVLPFGGRHVDAAGTLESMVPGRLAKNPALRDCLLGGMQRAWTHEKGLLVPTISIPIDGQKVEQWLEFVVKGLASHHWNLLIPSDWKIMILPLTPEIHPVFARLRALRAADRVCSSIAAGAFSYEGVQGADNPLISIWEISLYGGVTVRGGEQTSSKYGALVGPEALFSRAEKRVRWHRRQPKPI